MLPIEVILDEWARPPAPDPLAVAAVQFSLDTDQFRRRLHLDAILSMRIAQPGPLIIITGI